MLVPLIATIIRLMWVAVEYTYLRRFRVKPTQDWDRHSSKVWDFAHAFEVLGMVLGFLGIGRMQVAPNLVSSIGLVLLVTGIAIRWVAIFTLGKYFTGTVIIKTDHQLVRAGIYKHLRHPSYTGLLLGHLGVGLAFANWYSLSMSSLPYLLAALYRMRVEERALTSAFGADYAAYCQTSKRLIPGLY
jgi:protein-S-isoprenylcysteine O-methyltransferase Ste14